MGAINRVSFNTTDGNRSILMVIFMLTNPGTAGKIYN
jgi:hypothetical protein